MRTRTRHRVIAITLALGVSLLTFTIRACTSSVHVAADLVVVDGDTIKLILDGEPERVRVLGIDAPEKGQCGADEATARLDALITAGHVTVVPDPVADARDRWGRLLNYLEVDGTDVGQVLVDEGYAVAWWPRSAPAPSRAQSYLQAQRVAERETRGSWATCESFGRS